MKKLANGELVTVKIVHADGRIALADGRTLDKDFRLLVRGYPPLPLFIAGTQVGVRFGVSDGEWAFCVNYLTLMQGCKYIVQTIFAEKVKPGFPIFVSQDYVIDLSWSRIHKGFHLC